jgi:hypothetical protein
MFSQRKGGVNSRVPSISRQAALYCVQTRSHAHWDQQAALLNKVRR